MNILKIILTVIYAIDCIALTVVVLMQEGKQQARQPGVDGPVTADGSLDIPSNGTFYFRRTTEIRTWSYGCL